jgi:ABC-type oligopeptide transport system ATPase subunit
MTAQEDTLIEVNNLTKIYPYGRQQLTALSGATFAIKRGMTLGIVGESGCGKSTLGRLLVRLEEPTRGSISYEGNSLSTLSPASMQHMRRKMQIVFQDPYASLNPRMTIAESVGEGMDIHNLYKGSERRERLADLLSQVGLEPAMMRRYPHEFSGGQRQRIGIARALAVDPEFVVCDEPLSALDACTQQQVMELLLDLKKKRQLTYLFISHDLNAVRQIADDVAVMYFGKVVEFAPTQRLFTAAAHPYTQALLSAIPIADPIRERQRQLTVFKKEAFVEAPLRLVGPNHYVAC